MGPITKDGIHPISGNKVHDVGKHGSAKPATPAAAQVPAAGATTAKDGEKKKPAVSKFAETMYPSGGNTALRGATK